MSLVPGRVVPQVLLEELVHIFQLIVPQLVRLGRKEGEGERGRKGGKEGEREKWRMTEKKGRKKDENRGMEKRGFI